MKKEIIVKISNITYKIWINKNLKLSIRKEIDNVFEEKLTDKDKDIIKDVLNSLIVNPLESIYISKNEYKNIKYNLYLDKKNNIYYTNSLNNTINKKINLSLNNMPDLLYTSDDFNKDDNEEYKRYSRKYNALIIIPTILNTIILTILLSFHTNEIKALFSDQVVIEETTYSDEIILEEIIDNNIKKEADYTKYTFDDLKKALESNKKIDDEFKEYFYKLEDIIDENNEYIKIDEKLLNKALNLEVEYKNERNNRAKATYSRNKNKITYYESNNVGELTAGTLYHEIGHFFQNIISPNLFLEISNEIWARETLRRFKDNGTITELAFAKEESIFNTYEYGIGYEDKIDLYYYIMDLMDIEDIRNYQWNSNDVTIVHSICGNDTDNVNQRRLCRKLLIKLNTYRSLDDEAYKSFDKDPEGYSEILNIVNELYEEKKGHSLNESIITFAFRKLDYSKDDELNEVILQDLYQPGLCVYYKQEPKSYFSDTYDNVIHCKLISEHGENLGTYDIKVTENLKQRYVEYMKNKEMVKQKTLND